MKPAQVGIFFIAGFVAVALGQTRNAAPAIVAMAILAAVAWWVSRSSTSAGYFTLLAPLALIAILIAAGSQYAVVGFGVVLTIGVVLGGREHRSVAILVAFVLVLGPLAYMRFPDAGILPFVALMAVALPVAMVAAVEHRFRSMELVPLDDDVAVELPAHAIDLMENGFDLIARYTVAKQHVGVLLHAEGFMSAQVNLAERHRIWEIDSHGHGVKLRTASQNLGTFDDRVFVQLTDRSVAESLAWHRSMLDAARAAGWQAEAVTAEQVLTSFHDAFDAMDVTWRIAANMLVRVITKDYEGVGGPIDASSPELREFLARHRVVAS